MKKQNYDQIAAGRSKNTPSVNPITGLDTNVRTNREVLAKTKEQSTDFNPITGEYRPLSVISNRSQRNELESHGIHRDPITGKPQSMSVSRNHLQRNSTIADTANDKFNPITGENRASLSENASRNASRPGFVPRLSLLESEQYQITKSPLASLPSNSDENDVSVRSFCTVDKVDTDAARLRTAQNCAIPPLSHAALRHDDDDEDDLPSYFNNDKHRQRDIEVADSDSLVSSYRSDLSTSYNTLQHKKYHDKPTREVYNISHPQLMSEESLTYRSELVEEFEKLWNNVTAVNAVNALEKYGAKENKADERRNDIVMEAVMADHLSRSAMCDPDQAQNPMNIKLTHQPGMARGYIRALHDTKIRTAGVTAAEQLLSDRVRFVARLVTRDGHDACRELTGFFFAADNSFTVYEYRHFGKSYKALPFIQRGKFVKAWGKQKGLLITIFDIFVGNTLYLSTQDHNTLPETLRGQQQIKLRICEIDDLAMRKVIETQHLNGRQVPDAQWPRVLSKMHMPTSPLELEEMLFLQRLQDEVREAIRRRGVATWIGLHQYYAHLEEEDGYGQLPRHDLEMGLRKFRVPLSEEQFDRVWDIVDQESKSFAEYDDYLHAVFGNMPEPLVQLVRKAYQKLDTNRKGEVTFTDIGRFYRAASHPSVWKGKLSAKEVLDTFLDAFQFCARREVVTAVEFLIYYEGLYWSLSNSHEEFVIVVCNSWNIT